MTSLPVFVKVLLALGLIVSIGLAFFGRGPSRPASRRLVMAVAGGGLIGYLVGLHAAINGRHAFAAALIAVEPEPADPGDEGGPDWDEFDRKRALWARPRPRDREPV